MNWWQTLLVALRALRRNKLRSALTTLGVVIGVAAVIAMVSLGEGAKREVEEAFTSMGANLLMVRSGSTARGGVFGGAGSMPSLTWGDLEAIRDEARAVRAAAVVMQSSAQVQSEEQNWGTSVTGTSPEFFTIRNWRGTSGRLFTASDVDGATKVAVLGRTVAERLFGAADPVDQSIRINNIPFQVIGVLESKGQSHHGRDNDDVIIVPQTTYQAKIQGGLQKFIPGVVMVSATSAADALPAEMQIRAILRDRHRLGPEDEDDFSIRNLSEFASAQQQGTRTLTTLLAAIAAVSLLVGGIGIMNIMLVSVTERTREIGLRMAVGARPRDILAQFLAEALTLSLAGGLLGVLLGLVAAQQLAAAFRWPLLIRADILLVSVVFSALVGVVFGIYPARKASRLDPIEALRYE